MSPEIVENDALAVVNKLHDYLNLLNNVEEIHVENVKWHIEMTIFELNNLILKAQKALLEAQG